MDYVWSPWRYAYIAGAIQEMPSECIFCDALRRNDDAKALIAYRGKKSFVILNRYPYTSGHVMIVPYAHVSELEMCDDATQAEMMRLATRVEHAFKENYKPDGVNLGMNLGKAAGAGVAGHLHMHALPRWFGDTNFMTVVGETRVHPEELNVTYERMKKSLAAV
jgi:ATP adenylyltransferase